MRKLMVLLLLLTLPAAVGAAGKKHVKTSAEKECSECHTGQEQAWLSGKHGLMGVKCVVCHGSPEENFVSRPELNRCRGCHGEQVADIEKKLPQKDRTCFLCHEQHTVAVKESAKNKSGFHGQGGGK